MPRTVMSCCLAVSVLLSGGCAGFFGNRKVDQLEAETERLLSDYQLEKQRADRLDTQNRALVEHISDLERRLNGSRPRPAYSQIEPQMRSPQSDSWRVATRR